MNNARLSDDAVLPPGWSSRIDPKYNRRYYFNKATRESSWTRPEPEVSRKAKDSVGSQPSQKTTHVKKDNVDEMKEVWTKVYSKTYDKFYYYNKTTGKTTWKDPCKKDAVLTGSDRGGYQDVKGSSKVNRERSIKTQSSNDDAFSSGDEEDDFSTSVRTEAATQRDDDPDAFQQKMMEQFPALKKAFLELEEGQKRLQKEREEHERKVKRELEMVNAKLEELRKASAVLSTPASSSSVRTEGPGETVNTLDHQNVDNSAGRRSINARPRKFTLEQDLRRYSIDLEQRSLNVVEKRKSMRATSGIRSDDIKQVMEEANRLAAERGNLPATAESAKSQLDRISDRFPNSSQQDEEMEDGNAGIQEIEAEMDGVTRGLEYAMKEAEAQNEAAEEAQIAGDENEYYNLLQVKINATEAELKKAYRRKLIEWHPDKVRPEKREQAVKMTDLIQNAFKVLNDPWEREIYDWFGFEQYLLHVKVLACFKNYLVAGIELIKHPRKGRPRKRMVWLDKDFTEILTFRKRIMEDQRNGREKIKGVAIASITDVTVGKATEVFKRTGRSSNSGRYFSLICNDRTLDFECPSEESCNFIATRMKLLIIDLKRDKEWMHRHYDEMDRQTT